jgi:hypothetical protein
MRPMVCRLCKRCAFALAGTVGSPSAPPTIRSLAVSSCVTPISFHVAVAFRGSHVLGTSCARCPASLPQEAHPRYRCTNHRVTPREHQVDHRRHSPSSGEVKSAPDALGERIAPEISAGHPRSPPGTPGPVCPKMLRTSSDQRRNHRRRTRWHRLAPHGTPGRCPSRALS